MKIVRRKLADGTVKEYRYERKATRQRVFTVGSLITEYRRSPEFQALRPNTVKTYLRAFDRMRYLHDAPIEAIKHRHVVKLRNEFMETPALADQVKNVFGLLMKFAVTMEYRETNPAAGIRNIAKGHHERWSDEQVAYALANLGERYRRAVVLGLYTGQRAGDIVRMTWGDYDGEGIHVAQEKTGAKLWIPAHHVLRAELEAWKRERTAVAILTERHGRPYANPGSFSTAFSARIRQHAQLKGLVFHGLRKVAAAKLAEAGCSTLEIAAITGHRTLQMIELYARQADQRTRAKAAIVKLESFRGDKQ